MHLTEEQRHTLERIGDRYDLKFIVLHGSYATGRERAESDIDIAVLGKKCISSDTFLKIQNEIGDILGDGPERELDFKSLHGVDPLFRYYATRDSQLLYGDRTEFNDYKLYAESDYEDTHALRALEETMTRAKIEDIERQLASAS